MQNYVECDGEWARRQPVRLEHVSMYLFILPAHHGALQLICDRRINSRPTGDTVRATPLLPGVILACADIRFVRSEDPEDADKGYLTEKDVGFFVPVTLEARGTRRTAALVPYLFVDNMAGVLGGREIYGFPKELGQIAFDGDALSFEVRSLVLPVYGRDERAVQRPVVQIAAAGPVLHFPLSGDVLEATARVVEKVIEVLRLDPHALVGGSASTGFAEVPLLFLKQFRDATNSGAACYQSLVRADATIETLRGGKILAGDFEITLPPYDSLRIAETLGLIRLVPLVQHFTTLAAFVVDIDFRLPVGESLWVAT